MTTKKPTRGPSRRAFLGGAAIGTVAATVATPMIPALAKTDDSHLLGVIADFHKAYAEGIVAHDEWIAEKDRVEALPECPPIVMPAPDRAGYDRYFAFMKEHGVEALVDRSTELWRGVGRIVNAVFAAEAHTLQGAVEKLKIVHLAFGDGDDSGDDDLEARQDYEGVRWFASTIRDFERLAGKGTLQG